jgi:hypothetical protein
MSKHALLRFLRDSYSSEHASSVLKIGFSSRNERMQAAPPGNSYRSSVVLMLCGPEPKTLELVMVFTHPSSS